MVELSNLRYFVTIAECGSMTAAAKVLRVSQPTLTVAVKNLEDRLKTTLLIRGRNGVTLTSSGQELLRHADQVFKLLDEAEQRILGLETDDVGRFVIGCHESLGAYFLPEFMGAFLKRAPRIELSLWNGSSEAVSEAVLARNIDFGLIVNARPHPDLVLVDLFKDAVDIVVAVNDPKLDHGAASIEAAHARLRAGPLIFAGRVDQSKQLIDVLAADGLLPTRRLSCGDLELVKSLVLGGVGVGLLPRRVAAYGQPGRLRRLHPALPFIPDVISLAYRADTHRTRAATRLKDALVEHGRTLEDPDGGLGPPSGRAARGTPARSA